MQVTLWSCHRKDHSCKNAKSGRDHLLTDFEQSGFGRQGTYSSSPETVRLFLCTAAHHLLHDRDYFNCIESWFRDKVERTQSLGSEAWSAYFMCVAARRVDLALQVLLHMEQDARVRFDPVVFNYMLHPSEVMQNESGTPHALSASALTKGFLQQRRVLHAMQDEEEAAGAAAGATRRGGGAGTVAAGVHAMYVFFSITRQVVQQIGNDSTCCRHNDATKKAKSGEETTTKHNDDHFHSNNQYDPLRV